MTKTIDYSLSEQVGHYLKEQTWVLASAESCTGGLVGASITDVPGSSQWYDQGFITYSNQAKIEQLQVNPKVLELYGAVSEEVAIAMAEGTLLVAPQANIAVSTTGVAGPDGGTADKPVGLVCFAIAKRVKEGIVTLPFSEHFEGDRQAIREQATQFILEKIFTV